MANKQNKTVKDLRSLAKQRGLTRYSRLRKAELIQLLSPPANIMDEPSPANIMDEPSPANIMDEPSPANIMDEPSPANIMDEPFPANIMDEPPPANIMDEPSPDDLIIRLSRFTQEEFFDYGHLVVYSGFWNWRPERAKPISLNPTQTKDPCPVCLAVIKKAVATICGHTFHKKCIREWAKNSTTCPVCRQPMHE